MIRPEPKQTAAPRPRSAVPIKKDWSYYRRGTTGCGGTGNLWQDLHHTPDVRLEGIVSKSAIKVRVVHEFAWFSQFVNVSVAIRIRWFVRALCTSACRGVCACVSV